MRRRAPDASFQDQALCAIRGGAIKQRLARQGQGKSGGFRSIVLFRHEATAFSAYGFAKNDRENIDRQELKAFRLLAAEMLAMDGNG